jgi:hypothetical protein
MKKAAEKKKTALAQNQGKTPSTDTPKQPPYKPGSEVSKRTRQKRRKRMVQHYAEMMGWDEATARADLVSADMLDAMEKAYSNGVEKATRALGVSCDNPELLEEKVIDSHVCLICKALKRREKGLRSHFF